MKKNLFTIIFTIFFLSACQGKQKPLLIINEPTTGNSVIQQQQTVAAENHIAVNQHDYSFSLTKELRYEYKGSPEQVGDFFFYDSANRNIFNIRVKAGEQTEDNVKNDYPLAVAYKFIDGQTYIFEALIKEGEVYQQAQALIDNFKIDNDLVFKDKSTFAKYFEFKIEQKDDWKIQDFIIANSGDKVVYSEINNFDQTDAVTAWQQLKYRIYIKSKNSARLNLIYSYDPPQTSWLQNIINPVQAGGCCLLPQPMVWSADDNKIIFNLVNPTNCGAGGGSIPGLNDFAPFLIYNPPSRQYYFLKDSAPVFFNNFSQVAFTSNNSQTKSYANSAANNHGQVILKNLSTGREKIIAKAVDTLYQIIKEQCDNSKIVFSAQDAQASLNWQYDFASQKITQINQ